jgi:hypothetical protein
MRYDERRYRGQDGDERAQRHPQTAQDEATDRVHG